MLRIRPATIHDATLLWTMIRELAEFEHELQWVSIRPEDLERDGFGDQPSFRALVAEWNDQPAGYALLFPSYSTWVGRGLFLEDLFVREAFRRRGVGKALLAAAARMTVDEGCHAMQWEVLHWNRDAVALYESLGAEFRDKWRPVLLTGEALLQLAQKSK